MNGFNASTDHRRQEAQQVVKSACDQLRADGVDPRNYVEQLAWLFFLKAFDEMEGRREEEASFDDTPYRRRLDGDYRWSNWSSMMARPDQMLEFIIRLEVDRSKALPEYVAAIINSRIGRDYVYRTARRAIGMVNINAKQIQQLELSLPSLADQEWLVGRMQETKAVSDSIRKNISVKPIDDLPQAILQKASTGEL